jgi:AcrR family transcriptional regulator
VTAASDGVQALDGRELGTRGTRTRRALLDATARLLEARGARELRVVDIARAVGTSPAAFYQYFRDVDDAVLVLAEEAGEEAHRLAELVDERWAQPRGLTRVRRLVEGFLEFYDAHRAVLRVRNLSAQEGDDRFRVVRAEANAPLINRFQSLVASSQAAGRVAPELAPVAAAAALVSLLERMAAFHTELEEMGVDRAALVETTARIVHQTLVG